MAKRYSYRVWIGRKNYHAYGENSEEAKRAAANQHKNRGYDRNKTIAQIMRMAEARRA